MITNDRELQAALQWMEYWRQVRSGEQSWIGNEQARHRMAELRGQIDDYRRRAGLPPPPHPTLATPQRQPEATGQTIDRAAIPGDDSSF